MEHDPSLISFFLFFLIEHKVYFRAQLQTQMLLLTSLISKCVHICAWNACLQVLSLDCHLGKDMLQRHLPLGLDACLVPPGGTVRTARPGEGPP